MRTSSLVSPAAELPYPLTLAVGGDGPKRLALEEMRERYQLHERIEMLGAVNQVDMPSVIYLVAAHPPILLSTGTCTRRHLFKLLPYGNSRLLLPCLSSMCVYYDQEAFCMAIVEAACCGLLVVSTKVGGIPEVLPEDMIILSKPSAEGLLWVGTVMLIFCIDLLEAVDKAVDKLPEVDPVCFHGRVEKMYNWHDVAKRSEVIA